MDKHIINSFIILVIFITTIVVIKSRQKKPVLKEYEIETYPPYEQTIIYPTETPLVSKYGIEDIINSKNVVGTNIYTKYYDNTKVILDEKVLDFIRKGINDICIPKIVVNNDNKFKIDYIDFNNILSDPAVIEYSKIVSSIPEEQMDELNIIFELLDMLYIIYKNEPNLTKDRTSKFKILSYDTTTKEMIINDSLKEYLTDTSNIIKLTDLKLKLKAIIALKSKIDLTNDDRRNLIEKFCHINFMLQSINFVFAHPNSAPHLCSIKYTVKSLDA